MRYVECLSKGTWLSKSDAKLASAIIKFLKTQTQGDILEIGTFQGGFLPILALGLSGSDTLFVNDLFEEKATNPVNNRENQRSYSNVALSKFVERMDLKDVNLSILVGESRNLRSSLFVNRLKVVHVDGSHLFENVLYDLQLASESLHKEYGICILDDYRNMHAPGVSKAFWNVIELGILKPLVLGQGKAIMVPLESKWTPDMVKKICSGTGVRLEITDEFRDVMFTSNYYKNLYKTSSLDKFLSKILNRYNSLCSPFGVRNSEMSPITYLRI